MYPLPQPSLSLFAAVLYLATAPVPHLTLNHPRRHLDEAPAVTHAQTNPPTPTPHTHHPPQHPPPPPPPACQVDALHARFCDEIVRLFDTYKHEHPGFARKRLYIAGAEGGDETSQWDAEQVEAIRERRRLEQFHLFPAKL